MVSQGKKLGKAIYVLSDAGDGKIAHVNYVPDDWKRKGADARTWAAKVTEVLGGKVLIVFNVLKSFNIFKGWRQGGYRSGRWYICRKNLGSIIDCEGICVDFYSRLNNYVR